MVYIQFSPSVFVTKALHSANIIQPNKIVLVTILFYGITDWVLLGSKVTTKKKNLHRMIHVSYMLKCNVAV